MRLYEERNDKRTIRCGYCFGEGHNKRNCPHLKRHFLWNKNWDQISTRGLVGITTTHFANCWHNVGENQAKWHFRDHFEYAKGLYSDQAIATPRKPRKKTKCGFCGSRAHTRRNCKAMKQFVKDLEQANKGFRSEVYDALFRDMGFGVGAFIEQSEQDWYGETKVFSQGLVTSLDMNTVSICNLLDRWSDYASQFTFKVDGQFQYGHRWSEGCFSQELGNGYNLPPKYVQQGYGTTISSILAPAPSTPSKDWFLGQSPAFDWVVKKRDLKTLWGAFRYSIKQYHPNGEKVFEKWNKKTGLSV